MKLLLPEKPPNFDENGPLFYARFHFHLKSRRINLVGQCCIGMQEWRVLSSSRTNVRNLKVVNMKLFGRNPLYFKSYKNFLRVYHSRMTFTTKSRKNVLFPVPHVLLDNVIVLWGAVKGMCILFLVVE